MSKTRFYMIPVYVGVDPEEAFDDDGDPVEVDPTPEQIKDYLGDAMTCGWDTEEYGNPVGVVSMSAIIENMKPVTREEMEAEGVKVS